MKNYYGTEWVPTRRKPGYVAMQKPNRDLATIKDHYIAIDWAECSPEEEGQRGICKKPMR
jgi:hypothetical protein